ncbi:MAG: DUF488 family protein [Hyphomonadaceae bacterium]
MQIVFTIGYEGTSVDEFIRTLIAASVSRVIDVREVAISRRKGFSKTALTNHLQSKRIEYVHLRDLGDPKSGREAARAGEFASFRRIYHHHLRSNRAASALTELESLIDTARACLLCYEADPLNCHRTILAAELQARIGCGVEHLTPRRAPAPSRTGSHSR